MSNAKSLVSDILGGLRFDGHNNYDQWHRKIKYLLSENDSIEFITEEVKPPASKDDPSEVKRHLDESKKDRSARFLMLSCMRMISCTCMRIYRLRRPCGKPCLGSTEFCLR